MDRICTSIEQSKKFLKLGLDINTADCYWDYDILKKEHYPMFMDEQFDDTCIPAWSLGALLVLMPNHYVVEKCNENSYACYFMTNMEKRGKTPIEAVYNMICYLLENNPYDKI